MGRTKTLFQAGFNTQPPEGGWKKLRHSDNGLSVSTHSRPKAAGEHSGKFKTIFSVSTHSRPKAAGHAQTAKPADNRCFNTQPPEGGWVRWWHKLDLIGCFNTQPPEGGWIRIRLYK